MNRKYLVGFFIVGILLLVGLVTVIVAPPVSPVTCLKSGDTCLRFPSMTGANLPGEMFTIPDNLGGDYTFIIVPFTEEQQINAETWLPFTRQLAAKNPGLTYYNIPIFPEIPAPIRTLIRAGMSVAISDESLRAVTITVFLEDRDAFLDGLQIPDTEQIQVFLLNTADEIVWRGEGIFTDEQGEALSKIITQDARLSSTE